MVFPSELSLTIWLENSLFNVSFSITGAIVHGAIVIVMLFWRPHPENPLIFFAIAGLWGVGDAVWQTQINGKIRKNFKNIFEWPHKIELFRHQLGLYGLLFRRNKEAAFSNYRLWESAGFVIAYAYSTTLCARMKLYILFGNLTLGVIGYIIVEIRYRRKVIVILFTLYKV